MKKKDKLKERISTYIQANIDRHYQYIGESGVSMNAFNRKFIPILLKEINVDIMKIIDELYK